MHCAGTAALWGKSAHNSPSHQNASAPPWPGQRCARAVAGAAKARGPSQPFTAGQRVTCGPTAT
eukprot:9530024-Alexandrium_andersonii.AAC.1